MLTGNKNLMNYRVPITKGAIGNAHEGTGISAVLLQKPLDKQVPQTKSSNYIGRLQNFTTKSQEPKQIKKNQLDKFQNRTKDVLQYKDKIEEFNARRYTAGVGSYSAKNRGTFTGFGNPAKAQQSSRPETRDTQSTLDQKNNGIILNKLKKNHLQSRSAMIQKLQTDQKKLPSQERRQKVGVLLDIMNKKNEIQMPQADKQPMILKKFEVGSSHQQSPQHSELKFQRQLAPSDSGPKEIIYSVNIAEKIEHADNQSLRNPSQKQSQEQEMNKNDQMIQEAQNVLVQLDAKDNDAEIQALIKPQSRQVQIVDEQSLNQQQLVPVDPQAQVSVLTEQEKDKALAHEIKMLRMQCTDHYSKSKAKKKKKAILQKSQQIEKSQVQSNIQSEEVGSDADAFMTQINPDAQQLDDELKLDLNKVKATKTKTKSDREKQQALKKCLTYLGIKDMYMMDNYDPNFKQALEQKTRERLAEIQILQPSYENDAFITAPKEEPQRHFYIEKFPTNTSAHAEKSKKLMPMSRSLAKLGPNGALVKVEQTQFPSHPNEQPKRLKVCKFKDEELQMMCSKQFESEKNQWKQIQFVKDNKQAPYNEKVKASNFSRDLYKSGIRIQEEKQKLHLVHKKLMAALEAARKEKGWNSEDDIEPEQFDPDGFVSQQFNAFNIADLREHQQAILNMYHQYSQTDGPLDVQAVLGGFSRDQQEQIKSALPSFKEKMAFVNALKKRWKEQKGYCSLFDKVRAEKLTREKNELKAYVRNQRRQMRRRLSAQQIQQAGQFNELNTIGLTAPPNDDIFFGQGSIEPGVQIKRQLVLPGNEGVEAGDSIGTRLEERNKRSRSASHSRTFVQEQSHHHPGSGQLNIPPGAAPYISTAREAPQDPASTKSLKAWESAHGGTQVSGHNSNTQGLQRNQNRDMNAIYQHAKQDMESLEKYIDGTKPGESPEQSAGKGPDFQVGEGASDRPDVKTAGLTPAEHQGYLESQLMSRTQIASSLQLSPRAKQKILEQQNSEYYTKVRQIEAFVKDIKAAERGHPLGESRDGLLGHTREGAHGGVSKHTSGPSKGNGEAGRGTLQVHLNQLRFDPQGHRHAGNKVLDARKKAVSTGAGTLAAQLPDNADLMPKPQKAGPPEDARILHPAVQFQPTNAMPIKRSASQSHVQRYRNIKRRVQRQMMVGEQRNTVLQGLREDSPQNMEATGLSNPFVHTQITRNSDLGTLPLLPGYLQNMEKTLALFAIQRQVEEEMRELERQEGNLDPSFAANTTVYRTNAAAAKPVGPGSQIFAVMGQPLKSKVGASTVYQRNQIETQTTVDRRKLTSGRGPTTPVQAGTATEAAQVYVEPRNTSAEDNVKIKHQIDLNQNLQLSHDEMSLNALRQVPSSSAAGDASAGDVHVETVEKRGRDSTLAFSGMPSAQRGGATQSTAFMALPLHVRNFESKTSGSVLMANTRDRARAGGPRQAGDATLALQAQVASDVTQLIRPRATEDPVDALSSPLGQAQSPSEAYGGRQHPNQLKPILSHGRLSNNQFVNTSGSVLPTNQSQQFNEMPKILGVHYIQELDRSADPGAAAVDPFSGAKLDQAQLRNQNLEMNLRNDRRNIYPLPLPQNQANTGDDVASNDSKVLKSLDSAQDLRVQGSMFRPSPAQTIGTAQNATTLHPLEQEPASTIYKSQRPVPPAEPQRQATAQNAREAGHAYQVQRPPLQPQLNGNVLITGPGQPRPWTSSAGTTGQQRPQLPQRRITSGAEKFSGGKLQHKPVHAIATRSAAQVNAAGQEHRNATSEALLRSNQASRDLTKEIPISQAESSLQASDVHFRVPPLPRNERINQLAKGLNHPMTQQNMAMLSTNNAQYQMASVHVKVPAQGGVIRRPQTQALGIGLGMGVTGQALKGVPLSPSQQAQQAKQKKKAPSLLNALQEKAEGPEPGVHYEMRQQTDNDNYRVAVTTGIKPIKSMGLNVSQGSIMMQANVTRGSNQLFIDDHSQANSGFSPPRVMAVKTEQINSHADPSPTKHPAALNASADHIQEISLVKK